MRIIALILICLALGAQAPAPLPDDVNMSIESVVGTEEWWVEHVATQWRRSGTPCKTDVNLPDGTLADIVTASTVWAVEFDDDRSYACWESLLAAAQMEGKRPGIVLVRKNDYGMSKYYQTVLVCQYADIRLKVYKAGEIVP